MGILRLVIIVLLVSLVSVSHADPPSVGATVRQGALGELSKSLDEPVLLNVMTDRGRFHVSHQLRTSPKHTMASFGLNRLRVSDREHEVTCHLDLGLMTTNPDKSVDVRGPWSLSVVVKFEAGESWSLAVDDCLDGAIGQLVLLAR